MPMVAQVISNYINTQGPDSLTVLKMRSEFDNSLWTSDAIWWHKSGSTLAQVIACCLPTPSHYLNQCWLIISGVLWHLPESNFTASGQATILYNEFKNYTSEIRITTTSPRDQWGKVSSYLISITTESFWFGHMLVMPWLQNLLKHR